MKIYTICEDCEGKGEVENRLLFLSFKKKCPTCSGEGRNENQLNTDY